MTCPRAMRAAPRRPVDDIAVRQHGVVCRNLAARVGRPPDRVLVVRHASVMQDDHVGRAAALALVVVRRRSYLGDDGGFGTQLGRNHTRTARTFTGADFLLAHDETLAAARGRDCAETRMRDKLERAPAQRLRRISGCCCRRAASLERDGRAGLSPTRPSNSGTPSSRLRFTHSTLLTIRYSLVGPDNTRLG